MQLGEPASSFVEKYFLQKFVLVLKEKVEARCKTAFWL